ncbi:hypothetical protein NC651_039599 [Populus alba x Populus x berolinensis]|nr:hypothetical protein NC651_039599 [Populus alba x Populus x berolinensis]
MLRRLPRGLSDHRQLLLGYQEQIKGWKPFRFLDCWLTHHQFMPQIESWWDSDCKQFPGRYNLLKKLYYMAKHLRIWNREHYGNQDNRLGVQNGKIEDFTLTEIKGAATGYYSQLFKNHTTTRPLMGPEGFQRLGPDKVATSERGVAMEELKAALWDCDVFKLRGPDAFNFKFYKKVSELICLELLE